MIKPIDVPFEPEDAPAASATELDISCEFAAADFEELPHELESGNAPPPLRPACEEFFAPGGPLKQAAEYGGRPYEFRPQQLEMSTAIADALTAGENLCIEAPTGVGKSFAYLVPLIYRAVHSGRPAVVSTETINLQEQLIDKDLPLLKQFIPQPQQTVEFRMLTVHNQHGLVHLILLCRLLTN